MSGGGGPGQSRGELETAKVLNTVATIGAIHPTYHAIRDLYRHKTPESRARIERTLARPIPKKVKAGAASLKARASKLRIPKGSGKKVAVATTGAWLGLHSAELVGDVMARRSINGQLKQVKGPSVKKNLSIEQSLVSTSDYARRGTGIGVNLETIEKRYFSAEADRQRRIGAASGVLAGTSIVTGAAAMRGLTGGRSVIDVPKGARQFGVGAGYLIPKGVSAKKLLRNRAALAAAALTTGGGAVASYKRGISQRNQTWS